MELCIDPDFGIKISNIYLDEEHRDFVLFDRKTDAENILAECFQDVKEYLGYEQGIVYDDSECSVTFYTTFGGRTEISSKRRYFITSIDVPY